ncbi:LysR family transcriptional regulator [Vibrio splendidus]|uniref:LysR family transcriptional regulator n=1 Tax=Vibrio splendidus TaxID=29497 RepID=UPI00021BEFC0|nr:LysR family transcriptional regulator [Vibrio splendidus]EGU44025.1 LysR family transcriptional regulator [Vibrio splendidus ATCC 33789]
MNLTHLETFLKVAQLKNFSAAAEQLDVSKGLVSRHIKSLESDLTCTLFHRTTRSVTLTEAGRELLDTAQKIEELTLKASKSIQDLLAEDRGDIRFTAPSSLGSQLCTKMLPEYKKQYPNMKIKLELTTALKDVEFGEFDVALRAHEDLPENLIAKNLGAMKNILVASPDWLTQNVIKVPEDIQNVECIQNTLNPTWNNWSLFSNGRQDVLIRSQGKYSCSSYEGIKALATAHMGLANLPLPVVEELLDSGQLVRILPEWHSLQHHFYLVYAKQRFYPKKLRDFINTLLIWRDENSRWFV